MKAEIIAVGTELLMGETQDTNSSWMGSRLPELGLELQWVTIVGDDLTRLTETIERAWRRSDVVFTIGGLGPTLDDMTRDGIAAVLGEKITIDPDLKEWLETSFKRRNINPMPQQNLRQASIIPSAVAIHNPMGTAPSWWIERDHKILATLPGPPREMMNMWSTEMVPRIKERVPGNVIMSRAFKTIGLSEAAVDEMVRPAYDIPGMDLGVYAKPDGIQVRAIAKAPTEAEALKTLDIAEKAIRDGLGSYIWGTGEDQPPETVASLLKEKGFSLAVLESCTGGLLGGAITDVPGSSDYFMGGAITYSPEMKVQAGVPAETIEKFGVVSEETAAAMADAARATFGADCGIGVTGVAGPEDQGEIKAGTVYIGVAHPGGTSVERYQFPSRRPLVRGRAVTAALLQLTQALQTS
ncbi:MAG: competence/damage-inducible protein A [Dehalococcoidia bacterium]